MLMTRPNPRQVGQAPTGWLKLNKAGDGSRYSRSQGAQWSRLEKRCEVSVACCVLRVVACRGVRGCQVCLCRSGRPVRTLRQSGDGCCRPGAGGPESPLETGKVMHET